MSVWPEVFFTFKTSFLVLVRCPRIGKVWDTTSQQLLGNISSPIAKRTKKTHVLECLIWDQILGQLDGEFLGFGAWFPEPFFMELWCLPGEQLIAQVEFESEGFIRLWLTGYWMLGNHRNHLITHWHVRRNSHSLAFELICTQFKDCLWKLRGTVPWEQRGRG